MQQHTGPQQQAPGQPSAQARLSTPMANVDTVITPLAEARVAVTDRGFLYGDSVYEVLRTYRGVPFLLDEHLARLDESARLCGMRMTQSRAFLLEQIKRTVHAAKPLSGTDVYIRFTITRGVGAIELPPDPDTPTSMVIVVKAIPAWREEHYRKGLCLAISHVRRTSSDALDPRIKSGNYLNNVLAVMDARARGADDAVMLNHEGFVAEASNSNVLFVVDGRLAFPADDCGNLAGTTKDLVVHLCARAHVPCGPARLAVADLARASECFITSATREIMPACSLRFEDGRERDFPEGGGEITRRLRTEYLTFIEEYVARRAETALF